MDLLGDAGATERSRDSAVLITPAFESVWPDVERRLRALLFRRGLDRGSADDIVQEVALRALTNRVTYASAGDLLRWAGPVACHLHVDLVRQRARVPEDVDPEHPGPHDVHGEVVDRIELERALRGIAALRPADRAAILDAVAEEPFVPRTRKEAVRLAVRRHRARTRLLLLLEQIAGLVAGIGWVRRARRARATAAGVRLMRRGRRAAVLAAFAPVAVLPIVGSWLPSQAQVPPGHVVAGHVTGKGAADAAARADVASASTRAVVRSVPVRVHRSAPSPPPAPTKRPIVTVHGPGGIGGEAGKDPRKPDDHLFCTGGLPLLGRVCV